MANKEKQVTTQMRFSVFELDRVMVAVLENVSNTKFIQNVQKLFYQFSESSYSADEDKIARVLLVRTLCDMILDRNLQTKEVVLNTISLNGKFADKETEVLNNVFDQTISNKEVVTLDKKISQLLKFSIIEQTTDSLINDVNNIKSDNYTDLEEELDNVENEINRIQKNLKDYRAVIEENDNCISFDNGSFLSRIGKVIEREKTPSSTIRTGIKLFNEILDGGFKSGRVYCAMAPMKNWKSGLLLNSCIWAKKYNHIQAKDPTKKPIVLYITLENSIDETIVRTLAYCEGNNFEMKNHTVQEISTILKAHGVYSPNDDSDVGLEYIYRPNKSITVQDIGIIMDDYLKEGKEVVFLVVDYLKRIRPQVITKDLRIDLGTIADDLHVLAIERDIPIFTAMQLNRSAISEMDSAESFEQKLSAFNRIGASHVSESIDIVQNVDLAFTMVRTVDPKISEDGDVEYVDKFLNFHIVASRYNTGDVDNFIHRFKTNNDMCLEEDADAQISKSIVNKQVLIKDKAANIKTRGPRHV